MPVTEKKREKDCVYSSHRDPIHCNDVINNGCGVAAPAAFKKTSKGITLFYTISPSSDLSQSAGNKKDRVFKGLGGKKGKKWRKKERRRKKNVAHYVLFPNGGHDSICQIMKAELDRGDVSVQLACKMVSDQQRTHKRVTQQGFPVSGGLSLSHWAAEAFLSKATTATV